MASGTNLAGSCMSIKNIKYNRLATFVAVTSILFAGAALSDVAGDLQDELAALEKNPAAGSQEWFALAQKAREAELYTIASAALGRAGESGLSPIQLGVESARLHAVQNNGDAAVAALRSLFDQGFTGVGFLDGDPVISRLAGHAGYDALIEEMSVQAYPCAHTPGFSDFDFWVGDWDVHVASGQKAGTNSITREERGCVLVERWENTTGGTGMSINYLDRSNDEWVQIWNAEGGSQINIRGGMTEDGMLLEGQIHYVATGRTDPFRGLWTLLPDGRVRQFFETSNDNGQTWVPWFEGFYTRVEASSQIQ